MIRVERRKSRIPLFAHVFIEEGERAVGVVLYRSTKAVSCLRIDIREAEEAPAACFDWFAQLNLKTNSGEAILEAVIDELRALEELRAHGPDITDDWPGSRASRRLPDDLPM